MYTHHGPYHRHPDGTIDFDRYRIEAVALRRQAMQESSKLGAAFKLIVIVAVTVAAIAVAPSRQDANACQGCASVSAAADRASGPVSRQWNAAPQRQPLY